MKSIDAEPLKITDSGMAAFFAGMAKQYKPKAIPGLKAILQFNFEKENYYLIINENECKAYKGTHLKPTLTIITSEDIWMKISTGELDGAKALIKKLFKFEGDFNILMNMSKIFSELDTQDEITIEYQQSAQKFDDIPDNRGPLKISGMLWMNIAFIPWIVLWIWGSISPGLFPQIITAGIALVITLYHIITNRPTLFETGTCIYLILAAILYGIGLDFFIIYSKVMNYMFLGGLWLGSLMKQFCLTAEYSRYGFPKPLWGTRAFLDTNNIICGVWGLYFLVGAVLNLIMITNSQLVILLMIISYVALVPMFAFTSWFQKWYPPKLVSS